MVPATTRRGGNNDAAPQPRPPPHQEQLDCWACDATVAVPLDPDTGHPALAFSCGWCGAVTRVEEEEEEKAERRNQGGERQPRRRKKKKARLSPARRILAKLLLPLASALSIAAATILGVGWVLPALFDEAKHPQRLLLADAAAAVVSFNIAVHFSALLAQSLGLASSGGPKQVVVAAAGVGRTPEDEDTVSVSFSGDSGAAFSGGGSVSGGGGAASAGGGGGSAAAAVFVGSSVPRGAYAGHERCELCFEAAARRSSKRKKNESRSSKEVFASSHQQQQQQHFRSFSASATIPPPPPRVSFSSWRKRGHRPPGAAHCLVCDACVADVDHHCSFVGTCVSLRAGKGGDEEGERGKGTPAAAAAAAEQRARQRRRPPRHHPSGRHFALLLLWLLVGSLYAAFGSVALLLTRREEVEASWRRASSILLKQKRPLLAPPPPQQPAVVRWRLGKPPTTAAATPPPPRFSRAVASLLALFGIGPVLLITSPPWMAAALGLAALSLAAGLGAFFVAADAARRVAAGESAADEKRRMTNEGENAPCSSLSLFESLSDLFGGGHPVSWLLPPWGNDGDGDEKED